MRLEFDPAKDVINRRRHGLSLAAASEMNLLGAVVLEDARYDYGEPRYRAYGYVEGRMHMLAFTMRGDVVRAISFRKANRIEEKRHGGRT